MTTDAGPSRLARNYHPLPVTLVSGENSRVRDVDGGVIEGLYAVGNVAASPTGRSYVGGGGTLGPIMLLARRAGAHAATS